MGFLTKAAQWLTTSGGATDPRIVGYFAGPGSSTGQQVGVDTSLTLDAVWACVQLISETIATLPLHLYRRDDRGNGVVADDLPLYRILHDSPNADMTTVDFWTCMVACLLLWGNGFASIARGPGGAVTALTPMRPDRVSVRRGRDGDVEYVYRWGASQQTFVEGDVLHIKGFSLDGYLGLSIIAAARNSLGLSLAAEESAAAIFRNGMRPSGFLKAPVYLSPEQRDTGKALIERFKGSQNRGDVPLLEGGWTFEQLTLPPDDAQLLETRAFNVAQVCRWFKTNPVLIGHMDKATSWGTGVEQLTLGFLTFTLRPHLKRIEQAIQKALFAPQEQASLYAEFNVEGLMRADSKGRAELYSSLAQNGLRTRNELRALDNMPPLPGGDKLTVQVNLMPIDQLGEVSTEPRLKPVDPGAAVSGVATSKSGA